MTKNPYLKRLLGEGAQSDAQAALGAPPETNPQPQDELDADAEQQEPQPDEPPPEPDEAPPDISPKVQELARQWQAGERMGVATALMFTSANYKDFVDLAFIIGRDGASELGDLLDELANSGQEDIQQLKSQPHQSILKRAAGTEEEDVL